MSTSPKKTNTEKKVGVGDIPRIEWSIGAFGLTIVCLTVGVLIYEAVAGDKSPPDVKLTVTSTEPLRNGYLVKVRALNEGGEPAAQVAIQVDLISGGQMIESRETQFGCLPQHSARESGVFFSRDPSAGELRLQALGYEKP